jgi:hypothetical protein
MCDGTSSSMLVSGRMLVVLLNLILKLSWRELTVKEVSSEKI